MYDSEEKGIRINKYLADSGVCSRREADKRIADGLVTIDGKVAQLGDRVLPGMRVVCDGTGVKRSPAANKYIMLNKPVGIVCTCAEDEPDSVIKFIDHDRRIFPIGRLDKDSEGLLLLTTDGDIVNPILRSEGKHEKEYEVVVDKPLTPEFIKKMTTGVHILDTVTLPCKLTKTGECAFTIIITQGLNRQIRRMCEALGYRVRALRRVRIMCLKLGNLKPGQWRNLTHFELEALRRELDE